MGVLTALEQYEEAETLARESHSLRAGRFGEDHAYTQVAKEQVIVILERTGRTEEASSLR